MTYFDMPDQGGQLYQPSREEVLEQIVSELPGWQEIIHELHRHLLYLSPNYDLFFASSRHGGLRFYANYVPRDDETIESARVAHQIFARLIDETELRSLHHCTRCGERGSLRDDKVVLCEGHS